MLTRKQQELLLFIHNRLALGGVSPSFDEMKDALGLRSKSGIHRLITGLEERGFIRRLPHRARALEVTRLPDGLGPAAGDGGDDGATIVRPNFRGSGPAMPASSSVDTTDAVISLPLYGRIAAGTPIEALRDPSQQAEVPANLLGRGDHYALEVAGDSMVNAGILDGDTVIIRRTDSADNGSIVVALVDSTEVTLKRLRRRGKTVALEPANPAYETRIFGPDRVQIQGRLVGLLRRYE